jgi:8-oxo-dGTP diphosphatase
MTKEGGKPQKTQQTVIQAAGGLLWRKTPKDQTIGIIHRLRYDDWTLPKGKLKPGETWQDAAIREVHEETGCIAELRDFAGCVAYEVDNVPKVVLFWNMFLVEVCEFKPSKEVDRFEWRSQQEALKILTYPGERALIQSK